MNEQNKGLNLPAIRKGGSLTKGNTNKIQTLDLNKKNAVLSVLKAENGSALKDAIEKDKGLDLVLVGDLTASMTDYHKLLKNKFVELCNELFPLIKNLRIGIVFYLDHDRSGSTGPDNAYITRVHKLTSNTEELVHFITTSSTGNGYDLDEAVEDALNDLNSNMNWKETNPRSVVLFGDASPHPQYECPFDYDFFSLTRDLYNKGVTINSVYCGQYHQETLQKLENINVGDFNSRITYLKPPNFFSWIANVTGGMVMGIENIEDLVEIIKASAAKDSGHLDDLVTNTKDMTPKKLKLIEIARKADQRKQIGQNNSKLIK